MPMRPKLTKHFVHIKKHEIEGSWWIDLGPIVISVYLLAGRWLSLGIHISFVPAYIDLHVLWFTLTIMGRAQAAELHSDEEAYLEAERIATSQ